jgi:hypothetical protein
MTKDVKPTWKKSVKRLGVSAIIIYISFCIFVFFMQENIVFIPTVGTPYQSPATFDIEFQDLKLTSGDHKIHAWYVPAAANKGTILFCHGNAGNLGHRLDTVKIWHKLGFNLMLFDYSGFGLSGGSPSEENCYRDVQACYDWLKDSHKMAGQLILHGRSLGGGVASWAATQFSCDGLILESTFTSIPDMGRHKFPILPIGMISTMDFSSLSRIDQLKCPLLVLHGPDDEVIPYFMGEKLAEAGGVDLHKLDGGHNSGFTRTKNYPQILSEFISGL